MRRWKYKKMGHLKTKTVSAEVEALGLVKKGTQEQFKKIIGARFLQEIPKIVLIRTAHILRNILLIGEM